MTESEEIREKVYNDLRPLFPALIDEYERSNRTRSQDYYIFAMNVKDDRTGKIYTFSAHVGLCEAEITFGV
jgi:hypothetical protein